MNHKLALFLVTVFSHSWLECTEYTGDTEVFERENCLGLPRPLDANGRNVGGTFGQDIGMDFRPDAGGRCQGDATLGTDANFPNGMRTYETGRTYTLAWAPKNHVAATCTNANIPDTFLRLYMTPYNQAAGDPDQDTFKQMQVPASFSDDPHVRGQIDFKGFQNCPRFCDDTDKSLCTGTFTVGDVAPGVYTFQWYWAFNSETDLYSTCWEAIVVEGTGTGTGTDGTGVTDGTSIDTTMSTTTLMTAPPSCADCCEAGELQAPGTGNMISYDYLTYMEKRSIPCPDGFSGAIDIQCIIDVGIINGYCLPQALEFAVSDDDDTIKKKNGTITGLSLALTFVILAFIAYVAITREWVTKETLDALCAGDEKKTQKSYTSQKDVESSGATLPVERKRVGSVFTTSNTELPVMPEAPVWYYVNANGDQLGPVKEGELVKYCKSIPRAKAEQVLVWDGAVVQDWTPVGSVEIINQKL